MDTEPSVAIWSQRLARLGIACWIASAFLSMSSFQQFESSLVALPWLGGALLLLGFLSWRRAWTRAGIAAPLRSQLFVFARPLVGLLVLVGGVTLGGATIAGDHVSLIYLALAVVFLVVGIGIVHGSQLPVPPSEQQSTA